ncbi:MAG: hypothetical protein ACRD4J_07915 [Nitrososphaeraceae archaeon]
MANNPESKMRKMIEVLLDNESNLIENNNGFKGLIIYIINYFGKLPLFDLRIKDILQS